MCGSFMNEPENTNPIRQTSTTGYAQVVNVVNSEKKPFRCPVCLGNGKYWDDAIHQIGMHLCHPCRGEGIVWG